MGEEWRRLITVTDRVRQISLVTLRQHKPCEGDGDQEGRAESGLKQFGQAVFLILAGDQEGRAESGLKRDAAETYGSSMIREHEGRV
jgi:hypothetical protein